MSGPYQDIHISTDLQGEIEREIMTLEQQLKAPSMDDRPFKCGVLAARIHALKGVKQQAGLRA